MSLDPFTLAAQFVNFFILLWLLKYFLFGPVTRAMDAREAAVEERFRAADEREARARHARREYEKRREELVGQREEILREARREADHRREELIDEARVEVEELRAQWRGEIRREREHFLRELRERAGRAIQREVRSLLKTLADADLERRMLDVFLERIQSLPDDDERAFRESLRHNENRLSVQSTLPLPDPDRERLTEVLRERFGGEVRVDFETDEELVCGLELRGAGRAIGWSVRDALDRIEEHLEEHVRDEAEAPVEGGTTARGTPSP